MLCFLPQAARHPQLLLCYYQAPEAPTVSRTSASIQVAASEEEGW